jgi:hypothetical protein
MLARKRNIAVTEDTMFDPRTIIIRRSRCGSKLSIFFVKELQE